MNDKTDLLFDFDDDEFNTPLPTIETTSSNISTPINLSTHINLSTPTTTSPFVQEMGYYSLNQPPPSSSSFIQPINLTFHSANVNYPQPLPFISPFISASLPYNNNYIPSQQFGTTHPIMIPELSSSSSLFQRQDSFSHSHQQQQQSLNNHSYQNNNASQQQSLNNHTYHNNNGYHQQSLNNNAFLQHPNNNTMRQESFHSANSSLHFLTTPNPINTTGFISPTDLTSPFSDPSSPNFIQLPPSLIVSSTLPDMNGHYTCICNKTYPSLHAFKVHAKLHGVRERSFVCMVCNKGFLRKQDLKRHDTTHIEGYHPFSCDICGVTFTRSDALSRHKKSNKCSVDGKKNERRASMDTSS